MSDANNDHKVPNIPIVVGSLRQNEYNVEKYSLRKSPIRKGKDVTTTLTIVKPIAANEPNAPSIRCLDAISFTNESALNRDETTKTTITIDNNETNAVPKENPYHHSLDLFIPHLTVSHFIILPLYCLTNLEIFSWVCRRSLNADRSNNDPLCFLISLSRFL